MNKIKLEWLLLLVTVRYGGAGATDNDIGHSDRDNGSENASSASGIGYGFFRTMGVHGRWVDTRRVFGGAAVTLAEFPRVCVLLDRYLGARCSGSVLSPHWVLTAAHCISPNLAYVKYKSRHPLRKDDGYIVAVQYLYKHPDYKVVQQDVGRGMDVTTLYHDMGLVRTHGAMSQALRSSEDPLRAMLAFNALDLHNEEVQVLGYGRTERTEQGEELLGVRLQLVSCERFSWRHCVCGVASGGAASGVCSGDSGGPVLYKGVQVGVTSMGPLECGSENVTWPARATSVFTSIHPYMDIINSTILSADTTMRQLRPALDAAGASTAVPFAAALVFAVVFTYMIL